MISVSGAVSTIGRPPSCGAESITTGLCREDDGRQGDAAQRSFTFRAPRSTVGRMAVDLLVFGPHPDDIEIGLGASVARPTAAGHAVGLCDLTRAELSSNGSPEQREQEAHTAAVLDR